MTAEHSLGCCRLGFGVQQSHSQLPRPLERRVCPGVAPHPRCAVHSWARCRVPRVGHSHPRSSARHVWPQEHNCGHCNARRGPAGCHQQHGLHSAGECMFWRAACVLLLVTFTATMGPLVCLPSCMAACNSCGIWQQANRWPRSPTTRRACVPWPFTPAR